MDCWALPLCGGCAVPACVLPEQDPRGSRARRRPPCGACEPRCDTIGRRWSMLCAPPLESRRRDTGLFGGFAAFARGRRVGRRYLGDAGSTLRARGIVRHHRGRAGQVRVCPSRHHSRRVRGVVWSQQSVASALGHHHLHTHCLTTASGRVGHTVCRDAAPPRVWRSRWGVCLDAVVLSAHVAPVEKIPDGLVVRASRYS